MRSAARQSHVGNDFFAAQETGGGPSINDEENTMTFLRRDDATVADFHAISADWPASVASETYGKAVVFSCIKLRHCRI
jgi:hypothetical protein